MIEKLTSNVLITGGAGFIGSHIVHYHLEKGNQVWVIDNLDTGNMENIRPFLSHPSFRFDQADIRSFPRLQEAVVWSNRIFHIAATLNMEKAITNPIYTLSNNFHCCEKVLEAMDKAKRDIRFIITSSSVVYWHSTPAADKTFHEDAMLVLPSGAFLQESYGLSKITNEVMTLAYGFQKGLHCVIARIFNTVGIRQSAAYGAVIPRFISQALNGEPITVYGNGLQTRSFCNVKDIVKALDLLIENPNTKGEIFNVCYDKEYTILEIAEMIRKKTNSKSEISYISYKEAFGIDFTDATERRPNIEKLIRYTGFQPQVSLEKTIDEILSEKNKKKD